MSGQRNQKSSSGWAKPVSSLEVKEIDKGAININVHGKQLAGPLQGFGPLWQKTYKIRLSGAAVTPQEVIRIWKEKFPVFWPKGNHFYASMDGISPGEVAVLNLQGPGKMPLATGIMVIYADDESFTFMTPQGHMLSAWITFSAFEEDGACVAQAQALLRATDPITEVGLRFGGHKSEDQFWHHTLTSLALYFNVNGHVHQQVVCVDPKLQWSQAKNVWHNSAVRTVLHMPVRLGQRLFGR